MYKRLNVVGFIVSVVSHLTLGLISLKLAIGQEEPSLAVPVMSVAMVIIAFQIGPKFEKAKSRIWYTFIPIPMNVMILLVHLQGV